MVGGYDSEDGLMMIGFLDGVGNGFGSDMYTYLDLLLLLLLLGLEKFRFKPCHMLKYSANPCESRRSEVERSK